MNDRNEGNELISLRSVRGFLVAAYNWGSSGFSFLLSNVELWHGVKRGARNGVVHQRLVRIRSLIIDQKTKLIRLVAPNLTQSQ